MNTIKVKKNTQLEYKHYLLTDTPGGWKRSSWKRKVRNTQNRGSYIHEDTKISLISGEVKINGVEWIASASHEAFANEPLVFWLEYPKTEIERKRRIFG